ncbi:uncharacterized protein LOC133519881 isoform X2 [Cydia pomonella]|uniref:uncharacterized protein LOC133519881 isoform X2 n=1 Tax=Cydia pomonella TaxID=82600 RepID=UPI002ADD3A03|nr:uncharacterized protein LOC133519881 isoform X2 [Cydia pomonella]
MFLTHPMKSTANEWLRNIATPLMPKTRRQKSRYCAKAPQLKECASDLVKGMSPCLPAGLDRTAVKSTNTLIDFVCDNNGARITSFVKADGPRCIKDTIFDIVYCQHAIKFNLTKFANVSGDEIASSLFTMSEKDWCVLVDQSLECLVNAIKSCPNPALGQLGQELHHVYLGSLSCSEVIQNANTEVVARTEGTVDTTTGSSGIFGSFTFSVPDNSPYGKFSQLVSSELCNATHAEDNTAEVKSAMITFAQCLNDVTNIEIFAYEMEKAYNSGVYDKVIQEFCAKAPQVKECTGELVKGLTPCLPPGLDRTAVKSTNTLIDFVCDNNGARITSFVKADGPRCIRDSMYYIAYCQKAIYFNLTNVFNVSGDGVTSSLFALSERDKCVMVDQGLECLVNAIKSCPNPALGQLVQEFHDVYLESLSCSEVTQHANTEVVAVTEGKVDTTTGSSDAGKDIDQLKKIKLELDVRAAELQIWNRENELNVQHTALTSDIKTNGH